MVEGDILPPNEQNITNTEVLVVSKQNAAATKSRSDAVATTTTSSTNSKPTTTTASPSQPPAVDCPSPVTKATLTINTGIAQISAKPTSSPPLPSPRMVKLPVTPSSQSTSTSNESLLTKGSHSPNVSSSSVPRSTVAPPAPPAEKRVRVEESYFVSPSKVLGMDAKASTPPQSLAGVLVTNDAYSVPIMSPTRNGRTVVLASTDSSPIAPDHAFTIKPNSIAVNLPPSALADPCLQFYSTVGCSRTNHCRFTHIIPTIGSENWLTLRQNLIKSAKSKQMARTLQPQPFLGLGVGFTSVSSEWSSAFVYDKTLVKYCMKSFFTLSDVCDKSCGLCHDLPLVTSAEWNLLKQDIQTVFLRARESFRVIDSIPSVRQLGLDTTAVHPVQESTTTVPNLNRDPCLYHHSALGCWDISCAYDHTKPVIGSTKWKQLKNRLEQLAKSSRYITQFRHIRPQAYLGMGIGFEKTLHQKITYCLPSFTTVGCSKMGCIRCHDLPQEESFEWAFLSDVLMQDIKDNQPQKYNDTFDLLPELKRRGLAMPAQPTLSEIESKVVVTSAVMSSRPSSASTSNVTAVGGMPPEPPVSPITSTAAAVGPHEPTLQAASATDLVISSACTAQDLLYLHTTEVDSAVPTATTSTAHAPVKSPVVTFTLKGAIAPPLSAPTPLPVPATSTCPTPCLHFYSTAGCGHKACKLSHAMPRIGTEEWFTLRERLQREVTQRESTLLPVSYLALDTGFKPIVGRGSGTSLVKYCLSSYTSLRCGRSLSCHLCHQSPEVGSQEWTHLKAQLKEYMITHSSAQYMEKARKYHLVDDEYDNKSASVYTPSNCTAVATAHISTETAIKPATDKLTTPIKSTPATSTSQPQDAAVKMPILSTPCLHFFSTKGCNRGDGRPCPYNHDMPTIGTEPWVKFREKLQRAARGRNCGPTLQPIPLLGLAFGFEPIDSEKTRDTTDTTDILREVHSVSSSPAVTTSTVDIKIVASPVSPPPVTLNEPLPIAYCTSYFSNRGCHRNECKKIHTLPRPTHPDLARVCTILTKYARDNKDTPGFDFSADLKSHGYTVDQPSGSEPTVRRAFSIHVDSNTSDVINTATDSTASASLATAPSTKANPTLSVVYAPTLTHTMPSNLTTSPSIVTASLVAPGPVVAYTPVSTPILSAHDLISSHQSSAYIASILEPESFTQREPCLYYQSQHGCKGKCGNIHRKPIIGTQEWIDLRETLVLQAARYSSESTSIYQPRPYLGLDAGFTKPIFSSDAGSYPIVQYCYPAFTTLGCPSKPISGCDRCHQLPVEASAEWERFKTQLIAYMSRLGPAVDYTNDIQRRGVTKHVPTLSTTVYTDGALASPAVQAPLPPLTHNPQPLSQEQERNLSLSFQPPCRLAYSTIGCDDPHCRDSHARPQIGSIDWYILRRNLVDRLKRLKRNKIALTYRVINLTPGSYIGLPSFDYSILEGAYDESKAMVRFCAPRFTTKGCDNIGCSLSHEVYMIYFISYCLYMQPSMFKKLIYYRITIYTLTNNRCQY